MIRSGVTPDVAEDILVKRFSGNPKMWGIVLSVLGTAFLLQSVLNLRFLMRGLLPIALIGLGVYLLRGYIFKPKADSGWPDVRTRDVSANFALSETGFRREEYDPNANFADRARSGAWRDR